MSVSQAMAVPVFCFVLLLFLYFNIGIVNL